MATFHLWCGKSSVSWCFYAQNVIVFFSVSSSQQQVSVAGEKQPLQSACREGAVEYVEEKKVGDVINKARIDDRDMYVEKNMRDFLGEEVCDAGETGSNKSEHDSDDRSEYLEHEDDDYDIDTTSESQNEVSNGLRRPRTSNKCVDM